MIYLEETNLADYNITNIKNGKKTNCASLKKVLTCRATVC